MPDVTESYIYQTKQVDHPLKFDEGKPQPTLVHPEMITGLARIFEYGLTKYSRNSWMNFTAEQAASCLPDSALRHLFAWLQGERIDQESGRHHLLHAAWNLLVMWWHDTRGEQCP